MWAVSVQQPWAWAIARGYKEILNRPSDTGHRGLVAIYASFSVDLESFENHALRETCWDSADPVAAIGGIVAVVTLAGVCSAAASGGPCDCGRWAAKGSYHWRLAQPRPMWWPVLALGEPGLWELSPGVAASVARLLPDKAVMTRGTVATTAELNSVDS